MPCTAYPAITRPPTKTKNGRKNWPGLIVLAVAFALSATPSLSNIGRYLAQQELPDAGARACTATSVQPAVCGSPPSPTIASD